MILRFILVGLWSSPVTQTIPFSLILIYTISIVLINSSTTYAASLPTYSSRNRYQSKFFSDDSQDSFLLRQYFVDALKIPQSILSKTTFDRYPLITDFEEVKEKRRKRHVDLSANFQPTLKTIEVSDCVPNSKDKTILHSFRLFSPFDSFRSVELIYQFDEKHEQRNFIPISVSLKQFEASSNLDFLQTFLRFDPSREIFFLRIDELLRPFSNQSILIESTVAYPNCETAKPILFVSAARNRTTSSLKLPCSIETILFDFKDIQLAKIFVRPKTFLFQYCSGSCSSEHHPSMHQFSFSSFIQSKLHQKFGNVKEPSCAPSEFSSESFLVRQPTGTLTVLSLEKALPTKCSCQ